MEPHLINNAIGKSILFRLTNFPAELVGSTTGIYDPDGWTRARLADVDNLGIWVENPNLQVKWKDPQTKTPLPDVEGNTHHKAFILIRWHYLSSIVCLEDEISDDDAHITPLGFQSPKV